MKLMRSAAIVAGGLLLASAGFAQEPMSLEKYLAMASANNPEIKSTELSIEAAGKKVLELDMTYSPYLSGDVNWADDKSGASLSSPYPIEETKSTALSLSAAKKFRTGTVASVGYAFADATVSPGVVPSGVDMKPFVRLEQSLLRDFNSGLTQAGIDKSKAAVRSNQYLLLLKKQQLQVQAQSAYWALSLARDVVNFRKVSLERSQNLLQWNQKRYKLDLVEQADMLQAQAACKSRQLSLQLAEEDEVKAARAFNELIGVTASSVPYDLDRLADRISLYASMPDLKRTGERADVLSAQAAYQSAEFADRETYYRSLPELTVFGSYALHGFDSNGRDAFNRVAYRDNPAYSFGLSFIVPLDYKTLMKVREGYKDDFKAAKQTIAKSKLSAANAWDDLQVSWNKVKVRLSLAEEIRAIQEKRVANEANLFQRGRTTTFQLITAQDDLDDATLNMYRLVYEELMTAAQAELFNTKPFDK